MDMADMPSRGTAPARGTGFILTHLISPCKLLDDNFSKSTWHLVFLLVRTKNLCQAEKRHFMCFFTLLLRAGVFFHCPRILS